VISRNQWLRIILLGTIIAAATLFVEAYYTPAGENQAITMGFVVFSLLSMPIGLTARSETETIFSRELIPGWRQAGLFGMSLFFVFLGTALLKGIFNTAPLTGEQWGICLIFTAGIIMVEEVIKFFMRKSLRS
jgi:magnesium-transporting ATPase (P-type)